jgi:hypothetical protein
MQQRLQKYNDLNHAVKLLRYVDDDTPVGKVFLKMYLVESGQIKFEQYKVSYIRMSFICMLEGITVSSKAKKI